MGPNTKHWPGCNNTLWKQPSSGHIWVPLNPKVHSGGWMWCTVLLYLVLYIFCFPVWVCIPKHDWKRNKKWQFEISKVVTTVFYHFLFLVKSGNMTWVFEKKCGGAWVKKGILLFVLFYNPNDFLSILFQILYSTHWLQTQYF